ncbi:RING finger and transmembrane domain-containing protein 2 [Vitis vinifera]|uniref:RING finger and transmembrane domain-containing protein 2 n=1 Tax=Vitis vinifera TaxID=29760 RepID=A0A438D4J2_VITVI|nr:RING finger and transmembrane domain-containing protein 2 [Vitis vinifera]
MSRRSSDSQDTVVNSEEINYPKIQNDLDDWKLPKVSTQEIYKKGTFKFFTDYTIRTSEMSVSLEQDNQIIRLLDGNSIDKHKKDGYNFIHLVQAGLNDDPVYFQCFHNFTVRLRDADILDTVVLHVKTHGFKFKEGNSPVSIITRFAYKSMTTSVGSGALCTSPKGETTLFHSDDINKSNIIIPMKIRWDEVEFPESWHFSNAVPTIEQRSERIEQIVQYPDGGGDLIFSNSFRHSSNPRVSGYEPAKSSSSSIPVKITREDEGTSSNPKNIKLTGVRSHTNLARPFYIEEKDSTHESQQDESPQMSPTYSQMINTISYGDDNFKINKELLRKDFYSEVNKEKKDWNYYPRPTFPDMQFEERNQYTQASYTSGTIYEWNIDGMIEYNILTKLQEMTMVSTAYKLNNRLPDHAVAQTIVAGFIGQLKGWWDNYLTFEDRNGILKAYRINEKNEVVKDEDGHDIEDAVATLIYSISKHFIGDPAKIKDKTADLLTNLKCPKLHDFRWYKEVFLTKVMLRSDCNQSFWKEKFISGLPRLFSERIRIKIRERFNGQISYDKLTYGEIISIVTAEGIKLSLAGFFVTIWISAVMFKSNEILRKQTALKGERKISVLVGISLVFTLHVAGVYWWYHNGDLLYPLIMLPPKAIPPFWHAIFIIMVNDTLVRQAAMVFKCILLMYYKNSRGRNYRKQGQLLTLVEYTLLLYRALLPAPVWYRFFLNKEYGSLFSSLMTGLYLTFKLTSVVEKVQSFFAALKALSRKEVHYGAYATSEQVNAAGDLCAICQEKMHAPILLRCKHIFCEDCVSEWFERERTCPLCRALVKPADLRSYGDGSTSLFFQLF